jgi:hypothetical protein
MYCGSAPPKYLGMVFFGFTYVWMGLAAFAQSASESWSLGYSLSEGIQLEGALIVVVGIAMYDVGRVLSRRIRSRHGAAFSSVRVRRLSSTRVRLLAWIVLLSSPVAIVALGGLGALFSNRTIEAGVLFPSGVVNGVAQAPSDILPGTLLADGTTVLSFVALYAWLLIRRERKRAGLRSSAWDRVLLGGLVIVNVIVNNPLSNPRQWFGTVVIALALALPISRTTRGKMIFVAGMLVATSILFTYGNAFRGSSYTSQGEQGKIVQTWLGPDYDAAVEVAATAQYVQVEGLSYGQDLAGDVLFWVPRRFWTSKPIGTGYTLGYFFGTATPNVAAPLWAEGFIDFGWVGVIIFLLTLGLVSALLDRGTTPNYGTLELRSLILPLLAGYSFIFLRGPILPAMPVLTVFSIALWLLCPRVSNEPVRVVRGRDDGDARLPTKVRTSVLM